MPQALSKFAKETHITSISQTGNDKYFSRDELCLSGTIAATE